MALGFKFMKCIYVYEMYLGPPFIRAISDSLLVVMVVSGEVGAHMWSLGSVGETGRDGTFWYASDVGHCDSKFKVV
jgi:hypothetical protein